MLSAGTRQQFEQVTNLGQQALGRITTAEPAICELTQYIFSNDGELAEAGCIVNAAHERGNAAYTVNLVYRNDEWKLLGFFFKGEVTQEAPVQVEFTPTRSPLTKISSSPAIAVSLKSRSIGMSKPSGLNIGVGAATSTKIENVTAE